jgi:hypothetical protein
VLSFDINIPHEWNANLMMVTAYATLLGKLRDYLEMKAKLRFFHVGLENGEIENGYAAMTL